MKCTKCGGHIHSSRTLCNKCAGVEPKAFVSTDKPKTKGGMVNGKWESGNKRAARAGVADILEMLET